MSPPSARPGLARNLSTDDLQTLAAGALSSGDTFLAYAYGMASFQLETDRGRRLAAARTAFAACLMGNRMDEAERVINAVTAAYPDDRALAQELAWESALFLYSSGKPVEAEFHLRSVRDDPAYATRAKFLLACARLKANQPSSSAELLRGLEADPAFPHREPLPALAADIERTPDIGHKSRVVGVALSGVLPGAGQIYSGLVFDGIQSFTFCAGFGYATVASWEYGRTRDDVATRWVLPVLITSVFAVFYASNIENAANSARRANLVARARWVDGIVERLDGILSDQHYFLGTPPAKPGVKEAQ
jgi:hypothetical protein